MANSCRRRAEGEMMDLEQEAENLAREWYDRSKHRRNLAELAYVVHCLLQKACHDARSKQLQICKDRLAEVLGR